MDKIIEVILKLIPFRNLFELLGFNKETSATLGIIVSSILLYLIFSRLKMLQQRLSIRERTKDLAPYFDYQKVRKSTKYFIQSRGQNHSPTHEEEPSYSIKFIVKRKLIPWFLKTAFNEEKTTNKFYLILADSGMGKTTFMINLYIQYNSIFNFQRKYNIKLIPFGDDRIIDQLKEMSKKQDEVKNTILLLDAFDEFKDLLIPELPDNLTDDQRFRKRLDEIVELTRDFREVVITSRTQYFPNQEYNPYELQIPSFNEEGFHTLIKLYLSPFNDKEIRRYLNKKFGVLRIWNYKKKSIASKIVLSSPKLMVRPMLLSYIDYFLEGNKKFNYTFEIYQTLISKWIEREANKRKFDLKKREKFKEDLNKFSYLLSLEIYNKRKQSTSLSVNKETAKNLCTQNNIDLKDYEITGQSLLTRDGNNNWKFAHKSIYEFFIANHANDNISFGLELDFLGLDMSKQFCSELGLNSILLFNFHQIKSDNFMIKFHNSEDFREGNSKKYNVKFNDFSISTYPVSNSVYNKITSKKTNYFNNEIINQTVLVNWSEAIIFCNSLNRLAGYNTPYNENGDLLDIDGNITKDLTKVKGFRLPTDAEVECAFENIMIQNKFKENFNSIYPDNLEIKKGDMSSFYFSNVWCYDWYSNINLSKGENIIFENPTGPEIGTDRVTRILRNKYSIRRQSNPFQRIGIILLVFVP